MHRQFLEPAGPHGGDAVVIPHVGAVASVLAQLKIVEMRRSADLPDENQFVLGAVEASHPGVRLVPDTQVLEFGINRSTGLTQAVHDNLRNLGVDVLDVVNVRLMGDIHEPSEGSIAVQFTALAELQRQGLIRHLGLSNVTAAQEPPT